MTAAGHADDVVDLDFAAGAHAQITLDAGVEIDRHRWMRTIRRRHRFALALGEAAGFDILPLGGFPEFAIGVVRDFHRRLIGDQQFGNHLARGFRAMAVGGDLHARIGRADAGRGQHALALDLDHADAAIAVGAVAGLRRIAQMRQLDVEPARGAEDRLALADVDLVAVDEEGFRRVAVAHKFTKSLAVSSVPRGSTSTR